MKGNIFGKFKPKNHHFDHVYMKSSQKFTKLVVLVAKNLKKILGPQIDHPAALCTRSRSVWHHTEEQTS